MKPSWIVFGIVESFLDQDQKSKSKKKYFEKNKKKNQSFLRAKGVFSSIQDLHQDSTTKAKYK